MKRPKTLTARFVETVNVPGRYGDGRGSFGLSLLVKPMISTGRLSKSWSQRIRIDGRESNVGLGAYPIVSLAEARKAALANRRDIAQGRDPRTGGIPTFAEALDKVIEVQRPTWRNPKSEAQWRASLRDHAGALMDKPVDSIGPGDILGVISSIWNEHRETARRVKQRISRVMRWAIGAGHRLDDPAGAAIDAALPKNGNGRKHQRALPHGAVGTALATVRASGAWVHTKLAFEFLVLTATRSGEVRGATWSEIDMDAAIWTVPGERMKANKEHRIPLSTRALDVLREAHAHRDDSGLVFPSVTGRPMSDMTMSKLIKELGIAAVPHGFRSSFRDWCGESGVAREVAEAALAHVVKDKAEAAYARSDLLDRRREVMADWAKYVAG